MAVMADTVQDCGYECQTVGKLACTAIFMLFIVSGFMLYM